MFRSLAILTLAFATTLLGAAIREIPTPAPAGAMGSSLSHAPDGTIFLSWLEPSAETWILKFSRFDREGQRWASPTEIARGRDWFINWADFPTLTALSDRDLMAVWFVNNPAAHAHGGDHHGAGYHAVYALSRDGGATWSQPQRTTGESNSTEFTSFIAFGKDSRGIAAWLDGREHGRNPDAPQALYAQTFLASGPDQLVDASVCDCCQLSLAQISDDEILLAYRGRTADEVRDIRLARWRDGKWQTPRPLNDDGWKIAACPVNGPRLAARGREVVAGWFTGAQESARVQFKRSTDGGETFGEPLRVDLGRPLGRLDTALTGDSHALCLWIEGKSSQAAGGIYLRAVSANGQLGEPILLAPSAGARASGFPRLALLDDQHAIVSYTVAGEPSRVATLLVELNSLFPSS